jgi:glycosyltransferase involved in cell wall biosynthesis
MAELRVAIDAVHCKTGGGLTYLRNMLPPLAAAPEFAVHLYAAADTLALLAPIDARVHIREVAPWRGRLGEALWEQLRLPALLRADRIDVTFAPANFAPLAAPRPVVLLRNALGVIRHERRPAMLAYWAMLSLATWASMLRATRVLAVSDYARRSIAGPFGGAATIVPHGVAEMFRPGDEKREEFVLAVADLYTQKNLHTLVEAFALLRATRPALTLHIAGRRVDEGYARSLERRIAALGLSEAVRFAGVVAPDALAALYRRCAVFVFPSTVETFGNPLIEAMASGAPIACARAAAMPEILGDAGVYFDPHDAADMAREIAALLDDESLRRRSAERGIARAKGFTWTETAARTATVLREAAGGRRGQ